MPLKKTEEIGLLLRNGAKEEYVRNTRDTLGFLLEVPHPIVEVNEKQQSNPGRTNGPVPSEKKVWVTHSTR